METLLFITSCLANCSHAIEVGVMVLLNRRFWNDEHIWDAYKDERFGGGDRTRLMHAANCGNLSRVIFYLDMGG